MRVFVFLWGIAFSWNGPAASRLRNRGSQSWFRPQWTRKEACDEVVRCRHPTWTSSRETVRGLERRSGRPNRIELSRNRGEHQLGL